MNVLDLKVPFNQPYLTGNEISYIQTAIEQNHLSGDGCFTKKCQAWLEQNVKCKKAVLVPSCTAALEMAAILINIQPGDEVILPSYTFVTTASAFVLRGAIPVFVDIRPDTMNIDENKIQAAITNKTKAIVVVHYAGVACAMDKIMDISKQHNLYVIEDAAQALMSSYKGKPLGSIGHLSTFSFHATKNIISGEGGALCINDAEFMHRADIVREKGTNRKQFLDGQVDKYTWLELGSSYLLNEISAAFLYAQFEHAAQITLRRLEIWRKYHDEFSILCNQKVMRPLIPEECQHNAHIYYLLLPNKETKIKIMDYCNSRGISTVSHFVPLHDTLAGKQYGRTHGDLQTTHDISEKILRLPLWIGLEIKQDGVIAIVVEAIKLYVEEQALQHVSLMGEI